jgi:integrase
LCNPMKTQYNQYAFLITRKLGLEDKPDSGPTFRGISEQWLLLDVKPRCRATTYERYQSSLRIYVIPKTGKTPIKELNRPTIKNLLRSIVRKDLSRSSVETAKICISASQRDAMKNIGVSRKTDREQISVFLSDEVASLLEAAKKINPDYYFLLLCAFRTGMRLGEILALKWDCINWDSEYIVVKKSYRRDRLTDTKTDKIRQVDMSEQLKLELKKLLHQKKLEAVRKGLSEPVNVIFHDKNNSHLSQNSVRNMWRRALKKAGLEYRKFHSTRHTFASLMLAANVPISYIKEMLGHSSIQMTVDIYGHLLPDRDKSAVNLLDEICTLSAPTKKESTITN